MGTRKIILLFVACVMITVKITAQSCYVQGTAQGAEGKKILVKTFADYISGKETTLASCVIDSTGHFDLSFPLKTTSYAWFEIEYYLGEMYLEPGNHHQFLLKGLVFNDTTDRINGNLEQQLINVVPDSTDRLNTQLRTFNIMCNRTLIKHMDELMGRPFRIATDSLEKVCDTVFANSGSSYIAEYIRYRLASFRWMNLQTSTVDMFFTYLYQQPILYHNIEYMGFFKQYYEDYFSALNRPFRTEHFKYLVNKGTHYKALLDSMGADTLLQNEVLREMVMLETLKNAYAANGYKRSNVLGILKSMTTEARFEEHRAIAANLLFVLNRFDPGREAPDFALRNELGDTVQLSGFRGKPVYLHFFTTWNVASLEEMEFMRKLQTKYADSVQFISICCDREYMKLYHFAREQKIPWPVVHFNNDYELLESLDVRTYPYFILLDADGRYIANPAESPSGNIEWRLNKLLR